MDMSEEQARTQFAQNIRSRIERERPGLTDLAIRCWDQGDTMVVQVSSNELATVTQRIDPRTCCPYHLNVDLLVATLDLELQLTKAGYHRQETAP